MPVDQETVLNIVCDNPDCPGNELDPKNRQGWIFTSSEVYGETSVVQHVFCSTDCVSASAANADISFPAGEPIASIAPPPEPEPVAE